MNVAIEEIQKRKPPTPIVRLYTRQNSCVAKRLMSGDIYTATWNIVENHSETYDARQASYAAYRWVARRVCARLGVCERPVVWCDEVDNDPNRRTGEGDVLLVLDVPHTACVAIDSSAWYSPLNGCPIVPGDWSGRWDSARESEYDHLAREICSTRESLENSWEAIFDVSQARYGVEYLLAEIQPEWVIGIR